ncbi:amidase [Bradyrhizobium sp. U87765 SZCCT0131]|uniref:amidase n=1 Tax=unclassified Bradyrhizobium TaxID=2631580 RepID=UPI001BAE13CB|nr:MULTISPECIES: amidase [unclassified Bradyrhizobium]MBR1218823.1 amidase [Bradyrhizobium sp. U87765 SZCCT0131]MBR1261474.1 amidase [Bradyrhizobium sp. U87765 SZCCT0134]MBR1306673.1 amidase [Bradyrhizobium sp. U87765 SZCCT0110]MBR1317256.1 amidase [Bradyrhizobium sp. U87765 SZCCT0109]MBR1350958.1 amidase [Bradyrhizobium sp. U87765 SZCCT0048]
MNELADLTAADQLRGFARGTLSPVDVARAAIERIRSCDGAINAFCHVDEGQTLREAAESEARWSGAAPKGALDGVVVSVKDNLPVRGMPTRYGSLVTDDTVASDDAACVARLRDAGAIVVGKTTTPEMGNKIVTDSPLTGITRNPWNPKLTPGGSSGGAAAAVASGMGAIAVGTDGGGSIRVPAGWSGVFGLKPTYGRVPAFPAGWYGTMHHVGPLTRTVEDAALALTVMAGADARAWSQLPPRRVDYRDGLERGVKGLRIAYSRRLGLSDVTVDPETAASVEAAVKQFSELGASVEESDPPRIADVLRCLGAHWVVATLGGVAQLPADKHALLEPRVRELAEVGRKLSSLDYMNAIHDRMELGREVNAWFERYDLLVLPTFHVGAPEAGTFPDSILGPPRLTGPFNVTRHPAASIPCGRTVAGMPIGLQVVGRHDQDALVLRACRAYEAIRGAFPQPSLRLQPSSAKAAA